jgi:tetrahydromethanopterin S-methyltransferase subunit G
MLGLTVGFFVGPVCVAVGLRLGKLEGCRVGLLGEAVGIEVGREVGCDVGRDVGLEVGLEVGGFVGRAVGCNEGFFVGLFEQSIQYEITSQFVDTITIILRTWK